MSELSEMTLEELQDRQKEWLKEGQRSFADLREIVRWVGKLVYYPRRDSETYYELKLAYVAGEKTHQLRVLTRDWKVAYGHSAWVEGQSIAAWVDDLMVMHLGLVDEDWQADEPQFLTAGAWLSTLKALSDKAARIRTRWYEEDEIAQREKLLQEMLISERI